MRSSAHVLASSVPLLLAASISWQALPAWGQTNLVTNGSFEQLDLGWSSDVPIIVWTNQIAAEERCHALLTTNLWQDINCEVGKDYYLKFALRTPPPRVLWGNQLITVSGLPTTNMGWHYYYGYVHADATPTQLKFERGFFTNIFLDDVTLASGNQEVKILVQPQNRTIYENQAVSFSVGAAGAPPLRYQWYCNDSPLGGATNQILSMNNVQLLHAGNYFVVVSNSVNSATSSVAVLTVQPLPTVPLITTQPVASTIPAGGTFTFRVIALGAPPLSYQWRFNDAPLPAGTNAVLTLSYAQPINSGLYTVIVSNQNGFVVSSPATLTVTAMGTNAYGYISLNNRNPDAPVYDSDGVTKLAGTNYFLGVFLSTDEINLRFYIPSQLGRGTSAGYINTWTAWVQGMYPGATIYVQMRAWDITKGPYEAARTQGSKYGFTPVRSMQVGTLAAPGMIPMTSFAVHEASSSFFTGRLEAVTNSPEGLILWQLTGEPGFRYLIESQTPPQDWTPYLVLTNTIGSVTFITTNQPNTPVTFYRSRMLE